MYIHLSGLPTIGVRHFCRLLSNCSLLLFIINLLHKMKQFKGSTALWYFSASLKLLFKLRAHFHSFFPSLFTLHYFPSVLRYFSASLTDRTDGFQASNDNHNHPFALCSSLFTIFPSVLNSIFQLLSHFSSNQPLSKSSQTANSQSIFPFSILSSCLPSIPDFYAQIPTHT